MTRDPRTEAVYLPTWFRGRLPTSMPPGAIGVGFVFPSRAEAEEYAKKTDSDVIEMYRDRKTFRIFAPDEALP